MPTLNVSLTPEFAEFIEDAVASGAYMSASDVVRDALRMMRHDQESQAAGLALLRSAVDLGLEQSRRGGLSAKDVFAAALREK